MTILLPFTGVTLANIGLVFVGTVFLGVVILLHDGEYAIIAVVLFYLLAFIIANIEYGWIRLKS